MNPKIKFQKSLMELALAYLDGIESCKTNGFKELQKELEGKYSNTMSELAGELATIGKVSVTIHEEIKY